MENFRDGEADLVDDRRNSNIHIDGKNKVELILPARANTKKDSLSDLLPTGAYANVIWTSPGVVLLVSMERLRKSPHAFFYFLVAGSLARMMY